MQQRSTSDPRGPDDLPEIPRQAAQCESAVGVARRANSLDGVRCYPFGWPSGSAHIGIAQTRRPSLPTVAVFWQFAQASATLFARTMPTRAVSAFGPP